MWKALLAFLGLIVGLFVLTLPIAVDKTESGEVAIVRNGGPLDDKAIRDIIPPASDLTWVGYWSDLHPYPAQQRFYTVTGDSKRGDRSGVDVVKTPSSDGVDLGIEGTIYFTLNTESDVLRKFDTKFGTRQFRGVDKELRFPWEGAEGWSTFLDAIVRPVIENDLRIQINNFRCAELVSSCALLQNAGQRATGQENNTNIMKVQEAVNESLPREFQTMLGGNYFKDIRFNLSKITLPGNVQDAVNKAQAAYASVSESQAKVAQAEADAQANVKRQEGYNACPACSQIDIIKALPPGVTVYAPGAGTAVPLK